ncbi:DUF1194 domain-containing protein [Inquilinus sp. Marseille-Q2685]|uniref:DUF1194 domain-containing protein n=1 Tax=Inquilinus sp. Marseille-Q2685 TaxID=2866581 RepID=UPI001CE3B72E|nr:DUF1194 domain-containing protein [Inquilinus sp. Marseille-Q2685]
MRFGIVGFGLVFTLLLPTAPAAAQDQPVDLELVLAVDVSRSMDDDEQALQRDGYVSALTHPEVIDAITSGVHGRIAITYVEWAGAGSQAVILPWRLIDGAAAARTAAADLSESFGTVMRRGTSISGALLFTVGLFDNNGFEGLRRTIDISGDGPNNAGWPVAGPREMALAKGITINGLPIILKRGGFGGLPEPEMLDAYYRDCVIGGPGAFTVPVRSTAQFAEAIRRKLVLEIAGNAPGAIPVAFVPAQSGDTDCMIGEKTRPRWLDQDQR